MSTPKKNCHCWIRDKAIPTVRAFYPRVAKDDVFVIVMVDRSPTVGRARVYIEPRGEGGGDNRMCLWLSHVKAFPRCGRCDDEGHTTSKATELNCAEVKREKQEERDRKKRELDRQIEEAQRRRGVAF